MAWHQAGDKPHTRNNDDSIAELCIIKPRSQADYPIHLKAITWCRHRPARLQYQAKSLNDIETF